MPQFPPIDLANWSRREHFEFFSSFEDPCFSVDCQLDIQATLAYAKQQHYSIFLCYLYLSLRAANSTPELRLRLQEKQVVEVPEVHGSTTFLNLENNFGFCHLNLQQSFAEFYVQADKALAAKKQQTQDLLKEDPRLDVIYYSTLPWINFTSFNHPRHGGDNNSIPKIMFGQFVHQQNKCLLPVSVQVNHALVDGYHVGQFMQLFASMLQQPELYLT